MTPLAIFIVEDKAGRASRALEVASAAAALGRQVSVFFSWPSVILFDCCRDEIATALELGVKMTACATGLADHAEIAPEGVAAGGMISFLAANPDAQLLAV